MTHSPLGVAPLSVAIPTRNRPDHARACVAALLAARPGPAEILVVDQSDGPATREALLELGNDARVRYLQTEERGASRARNRGLQLASHELLAFTDDDCRVEPDWVGQLHSAFEACPEAAVICGRVRLPEDTPAGAWAASFEPHERIWRGRIPGPEEPWGISANMAVRRSALAAVGAFDPRLGPGSAEFPSGGEDTDLLLRVLGAGLVVVNAPEAIVFHLGFRQRGPELARLFNEYEVAIGAAFCKQALGGAQGRKTWLAWHGALLGRALRRLARRQKPTSVGAYLRFLRGSARWLIRSRALARR